MFLLKWYIFKNEWIGFFFAFKKWLKLNYSVDDKAE